MSALYIFDFMGFEYRNEFGAKNSDQLVKPQIHLIIPLVPCRIESHIKKRTLHEVDCLFVTVNCYGFRLLVVVVLRFLKRPEIS